MTVYAVRGVGTDMVKIGWTNGDIEHRLDQMQVGSPIRLELVAVADSVPRQQEYDLHKRFRGQRRHGEWFQMTNEQVDELVKALGEVPMSGYELAVRSGEVAFIKGHPLNDLIERRLQSDPPQPTVCIETRSALHSDAECV